jgi:hypothetical protein
MFDPNLVPNVRFSEQREYDESSQALELSSSLYVFM